MHDEYLHMYYMHFFKISGMLNADKIDLNYGIIGKPFFAYLIDFFRDMSCLARVLSNHFGTSQ